MDFIIANVDHIEFKIERDLNEQYGSLPLPFPGMDSEFSFNLPSFFGGIQCYLLFCLALTYSTHFSWVMLCEWLFIVVLLHSFSLLKRPTLFSPFAESTAAVCQFFNATDGSECTQKGLCPFRHIRGDRTIVCKHWLRGLCKKGDQCEFLHEYDMTKMPECYFYSRFNACHNKECPFLHIDPESKIKDCPWYDRGFCRHGPLCRHRHVRRVLCTNYLAGFCVDGTTCKYMHPRFELPPVPEIPKDQMQKRAPTCHFCGELGHKASYCQKMPPEVSSFRNHLGRASSFTFLILVLQQREASMRQEEAKYRALGYIKPNGTEESPVIRNPPRPLEEITCYKCGTKGHYANKCPKGHLAFLSSNHHLANKQNQQQQQQIHQEQNL